MHTSCLYSDIDWLIYADYLDDQNINHFIREDVANLDALWCYEYRYGVNSSGVGANGVGANGVGGFGGVALGFDNNYTGSNCIGDKVGFDTADGNIGGNYHE
jgi:hypothetical protein